MKKIGFIDYYLDCWHPHNFVENVKKYNAEHGTDFAVTLAWAERNSPSGKTTDAWCAEHGVKRAESIAELCAECDYIAIFSPDNPEKHLGYAREVFKYGKPTFIDKTFSARYDDALEMFRISEELGTPFFSCSSLRYEESLAPFKGCASAITVLGGGGVGHLFDDYLVHHLEMVMHCFGTGAVSVHYEKNADQELVRVEFTGGRVANVIFAPCLNFAAIVADESGTSHYLPATSDFFYGQISEVLAFFAGEPLSFDTMQTLELAKIKAAAFRCRDEGIDKIIL